MISQTAEYALRAIVYLADQAGTSRTVSQIAAATHVPAGYLAKVMQMLSRANLVTSQRGLKGGFSLALDSRKLSVLDVVNVVDPIRRFPECPLGLANHGRQLCPLHRQLDDAAQLIDNAFRARPWSPISSPPLQHESRCADFPPSRCPLLGEPLCATVPRARYLPENPTRQLRYIGTGKGDAVELEWIVRDDGQNGLVVDSEGLHPQVGAPNFDLGAAVCESPSTSTRSQWAKLAAGIE